MDSMHMEIILVMNTWSQKEDFMERNPKTHKVKKVKCQTALDILILMA